MLFRSQGPVDLQIVEDHMNLDVDNTEDVVDEAESTLNIFKKYIQSVDAKGINKDKLENKINELYHEALNVE